MNSFSNAHIKTAEQNLKKGFKDLMQKFKLPEETFGSDGGNALMNVLQHVGTGALKGEGLNVANWFAGLSADIINPAALLLSTVIETAVDEIWGTPDEDGFKAGSYALYQKGYKKILDRELDFNESAMFGDSDGNELLDHVKNYHLVLVENIQNSMAQCFDFVGGETVQVHISKLKTPQNTAALLQDKVLSKLRTAFMGDTRREHSQESKFAIGDTVTYQGKYYNVQAAPQKGSIYIEDGDGLEKCVSVFEVKKSFSIAASRKIVNNFQIGEFAWYDAGNNKLTICCVESIRNEGADVSICNSRSGLSFEVDGERLVKVDETYKESLMACHEIRDFRNEVMHNYTTKHPVRGSDMVMDLLRKSIPVQVTKKLYEYRETKDSYVHRETEAGDDPYISDSDSEYRSKPVDYASWDDNESSYHQEPVKESDNSGIIALAAGACILIGTLIFFEA